MKGELSLLSASIFFATHAAASGYGIDGIDIDEVNTKRWECKSCFQPETSSVIGIGFGYIGDDAYRFGNRIGTDAEQGATVKGDLAFNYRADEMYTNIWLRDIGFTRFDVGVELGYYSGLRAKLTYSERTTYYNNQAMSPYTNPGSSDLRLPSDWVFGGSTADMTQLDASLKPVELKLKREKVKLELDYHVPSPWRPRASFQQEKKEGLQIATGVAGTSSTFLPKVVDHTTNLFDVGLAYKGENWLADVAYHGSLFVNEHDSLSWESPFTGDTDQISYEPDNQFHQLILSGRYRLNKTQFAGRASLGQMTQDETFIETGASLPTNSLNAKVNTANANLRVNHSLTQKIRLTADFDYKDRDNKTDQFDWGGRTNRTFDSTTYKAGIKGQYRGWKPAKLEAGYDYEQKERPDWEREKTDENTVWAKVSSRYSQNVSWWVKYSFSDRGGSDYQSSQFASSAQNENLRRFNIADRERNELKANLGISVTEALSGTIIAYASKDNYTNTTVGLTDGEEVGYDLSVNYRAAENIDVYGFMGRQFITFEQAGSDNGRDANWWSTLRDATNIYGIGTEVTDLLEKKLSIGLDYTYTKGKVSESVDQRVTTDGYPDNKNYSHNVNVFANYLLSEQSDVRLDLIYERYSDSDYYYSNLEPDSMSGVLTMGDLSQDYSNVFLGAMYRYKF